MRKPTFLGNSSQKYRDIFVRTHLVSMKVFSSLKKIFREVTEFTSGGALFRKMCREKKVGPPLSEGEIILMVLDSLTLKASVLTTF